MVSAGEQLAGWAGTARTAGAAFGTAFAQKPGSELFGEMHLADTGGAGEQQAMRKRTYPFQQALPDRNIPIMYFINRYLQFLSQVNC
jgi:hypothetical protein